MPRNKSSDLVVYSSLVLLVCMLVFVLCAVLIEKESENAALKAEIVEWQRAAMPAIRARGWELQVPDSTKAEARHLLRSLNPCVDVAGYAIDTPECSKARGDYSSYGSRGIPIKIVLAR